MTDNTVTKLREPALVLDPPKLLEQAIVSGAGIEVIERLVALQERWEATQARKAYNAAMAAFKAKAPALIKNVEVAYEGRGGGRTSYKHEDLAAVLDAVDKAAAEHGLWVRFKTKNQGLADITVTCVIGHAAGHVDEDASTLSCGADTSGNKNPVQAIGSAVTYLQRYTLKAALGLAAARDDDGRASGAPVGNALVSEQQVAQIAQMLEDHKQIDMKKFLELAGAETIEGIMAVKFDSAMQWLVRQSKKAVKK